MVKNNNASSSLLPPPPPPPPAPQSMKYSALTPTTMKQLSGSSTANVADLPPMVPAVTVKVGNKFISSSKKCRKWIWDSFHSSARSDGAQFRHWVRSGVEYLDYPYARFDIHLDAIQYTDEDYRQYLQDELWSKSETDKLMELVKTFELHWAVIYDRWCEHYYQQQQQRRKIEDLQHRYYTVAALLTQSRIQREAAQELHALSTGPKADTSEQQILEAAAARVLASNPQQQQPLITTLGTGTTNKQIFDYEREKERRAYLEALWNRTKEEEKEEMELRKELKLVEAQLRKLKKNGRHVLASKANATAATATTSPTAMLDKSFASTAPIPTPGTPYLQSRRLVPPATGGQTGINKTTLKRMATVLEELNVPPQPAVPTKRVCDLFDQVRKDILTLLVLQKTAHQMEAQLQTRRLRFAKLGGRTTQAIINDDETLIGMTPAPPMPKEPPVPARGKKAKRNMSGGTKGGAKSAAAAAKSGDAVTKPKTTVKRKKKTATEPKTTAAAAAADISLSNVPITPAIPIEDAKQPSKKRARKT